MYVCTPSRASRVASRRRYYVSSHDCPTHAPTTCAQSARATPFVIAIRVIDLCSMCRLDPGPTPRAQTHTRHVGANYVRGPMRCAGDVLSLPTWERYQVLEACSRLLLVRIRMQESPEQDQRAYCPAETRHR